MKLSKSLIALAASALLFVGCDKQELPYDIDGVVHTFAINVSKDTSADLLLNPGTTAGDYKVKLDVPAHMGDYTKFFKEAELVCVYTSIATGETKAVVSNTGITTLPSVVTVDMASVCGKLGIAAPVIGDKMQFTVNIVHKDGTVVPGWSEAMGFNFRNPSFVQVSYAASYTAAAPLDETYMESLNGKVINFTESVGSAGEASYGAKVNILSEIPESIIDAGFTAEDYLGIELTTYDWYGFGLDCKYVIYLNKKDYSVKAPTQTVAKTDENFDYYGTYPYMGDMIFDSFSGEYDTQTNVLTCSYAATWVISLGTLSFGGDDYVIDFSTIL